MSERAEKIREDINDFTAHLSKIAELRGENRSRNPLHVWASPEELILSMVGEPTVVESLTMPKGVSAGPLKACYTNAFTASARHPNLRYAEGWGYAGFFPVSHAWCVDVETGQIVDPTWVNLEYPGPFLYMGLTFNRRFVDRLVSEEGQPSLFENDWRRKGRTARRGLVLDEHGHVSDWGNPPPF